MTKTPKPKPKKQTRTVDIEPSPTHAHKPAELIQIRDHEKLSLAARRALTILWHNAHQQGVRPDGEYTIPISRLTAGAHKGRKGLSEAINSLKNTDVTVFPPNGRKWFTSLISGHDLDSEDRKYGYMTYTFDRKLAQALEASIIWGRINIEDLMRLSSKYAVSLYEHVCLWANLNGKSSATFTIDEFRELLGVEKSKYVFFGELRREALNRASAEINQHTLFHVSIDPIKAGRNFTHIKLSWALKPTVELQLTLLEADDSP